MYLTKLMYSPQPYSRQARGGAALSPSPGERSAGFFRRYFSYLTPFFAFFPHCGAWSRAKASYAMKLEKLPHSFMSPKHYINRYKQ